MKALMLITEQATSAPQSSAISQPFPPRSTAEQHAAPTVFAVTPSLVGCYGNYRDISAHKKK
jgi:hypothetical protein